MANKRFINLSENHGSVILIVDQTGLITYCNPAIKDFGGYAPEDEIGQTIFRYFSDSPDPIKNAFSELALTEKSRHLEFLFRGKNRRPFPARIEITSFLKNNSEISFQCSIKNIPRFKRSEKLLGIYSNISKTLNSKGILKDKILTILESFCTLDEIDCGMFYITGTSSKASNLIAHHNLSGQFIKNTSYLHPDSYLSDIIHDKEFIYLSIDQFLSSFMKISQSPIGVKELKSENLKYLTFVPTLHDGETYGLLVVGSHSELEILPDVRELLETTALQIALAISKSRTDSIIKESVERHRTIFEKSPDAILLMDESGFIEANESAFRLFLDDNDKSLLGKNFFKLSPPEQDNSIMSLVFFDEMITNATSSGECKFECILNKLNGAKFNAEVWLNSFYIRKGKIIKATIRDITSQKEAEKEKEILKKQFIQAQKLESIGRLASGIAHDFNNLLAPILGFSEMALSDTPPESTLHEDLSSIIEAVQRAKRLTRQLLTFSRKQDILQKVEDFGTIVENFEKIIKHTLREDIDIIISISPEKFLIWADSSQIEQILLNLAINAQDAMPRGGRLSIKNYGTMISDKEALKYTNAKAGEFATLEVTDTGDGMDEEIKSRIFEPFFTTKEAKHGTGLGLSTVYGIVEQHGGFIDVTSCPGKGTTFKINLPIVDDIPVDNDSESEALPLQFKGQESILLVEDSDLTNKFIERMLTDQGYKVFCAQNAEEALSIFSREFKRIDLLLTDVIMPGMDGKSLYEELCKKSPALRVLYISGYTGDVTLGVGVSNESISFLQKPFTQQSLSLKIRDVLDSNIK